jgi:hypothetical protein
VGTYFIQKPVGHNKIKNAATIKLPSSIFFNFEHHFEIFIKDITDMAWLTSLSN